MNAKNKNCLINEAVCGRIDGSPVCPKCGMDERVVDPGQVDLNLAMQSAKPYYKKASEKTQTPEGE